MIDSGYHIDSYESWSSQLVAFNTTQVSFRNQSQQERWVKIWGANQATSIPNKPNFIETNTYPQAIVFNSINQAIYVVNQLAATLQIFNINSELLAEVVLDENIIPTASLVDVAINSITGEAYIIGSISNLLYVVGLNFEITKTMMLGNRPVSVKHNSLTNKLYVQHLLLTTVSVIDLNEDFSLVEIELNAIQSSVAVNEVSGAWATLSKETSNIELFSKENNRIRNSESELSELGNLLFSKDGMKIMAIEKNEKRLVIISISDGEIVQSTPFSFQPHSIQLGDGKNVIVSTIEFNQIIELDEEFNQVAAIETPIKPIHWTKDVENGVFYITDAINNRISVVGDENNSPINYSENYKEVLSNFQHQPILLKHLKVFYSDLNQIPLIRIGTKSSSGKLESRLISLHKYNSPQHISTIYDVQEIKNEIIDGRAFWEVLIPPEQTMTLLLYHS